MSTAYTAAVRLTGSCFRLIGVPILNAHGWHPVRFALFNVLMAIPIVNGAIAAAIALPAGDQRVFSTCIYVIFPNLMVQVKLLICAAKWRDMNAIMAWVRGCFGSSYTDRRIDAEWQRISVQCSRRAIIFTRQVHICSGSR